MPDRLDPPHQALPERSLAEGHRFIQDLRPRSTVVRERRRPSPITTATIPMRGGMRSGLSATAGRRFSTPHAAI